MNELPSQGDEAISSIDGGHPQEGRSSPFKFQCRDINVFYGATHAVRGVSLDLHRSKVTALIGPSGCGKTTFLRCLNRMNDPIPNAVVKGRLFLDGVDIHEHDIDVVELRRRVGMVFQSSNPFPMSIFNNVAYGLRVAGERRKSHLRERVTWALESAALWEEVKDRLGEPAGRLSGGQQQRLCIARALAVEPDVLLMDEPASALDPQSTERIEVLIRELVGSYTIIIVTHNMQQARRISDRTAFFLSGHLVEIGETPQVFERPKDERTGAYVRDPSAEAELAKDAKFLLKDMG
ncbi:MAG: phosphate ABC transporter ATP-binding protein [Myxococcales bacterium]|nr:phosphate ABC transporter ATP-binding protein [Myxococcales bacterium]